MSVMTRGFLRQVADDAEKEAERLKAVWASRPNVPTPHVAEEAAAFFRLGEAAREALRLLEARPEPTPWELDRALVARLVAIDDGLTEWEQGFVEHAAKWVERGPLTVPMRERAEQIDGSRG